MKSYRYIKLTEEEKTVLESGYRTGDKHYFRVICFSLLQSSKGKKVEEISAMVSKREETIRRWYDRWESGGIEGIKIGLGRGRKAKVSVLAEESVREIKKSRIEPDKIECIIG